MLICVLLAAAALVLGAVAVAIWVNRRLPFESDEVLDLLFHDAAQSRFPGGYCDEYGVSFTREMMFVKERYYGSPWEIQSELSRQGYIGTDGRIRYRDIWRCADALNVWIDTHGGDAVEGKERQP